MSVKPHCRLSSSYFHVNFFLKAFTGLSCTVLAISCKTNKHSGSGNVIMR